MRIESEITQKVISHVHCWAKYHSNARLLSCKCEGKKEIRFSYRTNPVRPLASMSSGARGVEILLLLRRRDAAQAADHEADDNNGPRRRARSLSLPRGEPIDLQFILTSGKSMRGDMKRPPPRFFCFFFLRLALKDFPKCFVTADNGNLPCL